MSNNMLSKGKKIKNFNDDFNMNLDFLEDLNDIDDNFLRIFFKSEINKRQMLEKRALK